MSWNRVKFTRLWWRCGDDLGYVSFTGRAESHSASTWLEVEALQWNFDQLLHELLPPCCRSRDEYLEPTAADSCRLYGLAWMNRESKTACWIIPLAAMHGGWAARSRKRALFGGRFCDACIHVLPMQIDPTYSRPTCPSVFSFQPARVPSDHDVKVLWSHMLEFS